MLKNRLKNENINELIIALNTTTEGQATSLYLKNNLSNYVSRITRIAFGVPIGADIMRSP
jgi:recombination protein RecR